MSGKLPLPRRRRSVDAWTAFVVLSVAFIAVTTAARWDQQAVSYFIVLCAVVSFRARFVALAFTALLGPLAGLATWPQAGVATGLLILGPIIVSIVIAVYAAWREFDTPTGRIAIGNVLHPWVRGAVIGGVVLGGLLEGGWFVRGAVEVGALIIPLFAYRHSHHKIAVLTALAASALTGWSVAPLTLAGVCLALEVFRLSTGRLPRQWHPLPSPSPWRHPGQSIRCRLCDRRVARSDLLGARYMLGSDKTPWTRFRMAFLDLEERIYQPALSLAREKALPDDLTVPVQILHGRGLSGTAQYDHARALYSNVLSTLSGSEERLYNYVILLLAENDIAAGRDEDALKAASWLTSRPESSCDYFMRQRALRLLAQHEIDQGDAKKADQAASQALEHLISNRAIGRLMLASGTGKLIRLIYGNRGSMYTQALRAEILVRAARAAAPDLAEAGNKQDEWEPEAAALAMAVARSSDDLVELYLSEARNAMKSGQPSDAVPLAACALMELDRTRYMLAAQSSRTSWSKRFRRVLGFALSAAYAENDHEFVAELLEFARVQTLPAATAETSEDLALSTPPIVLVKGRTRLARPGEQHRPAYVSLEQAAERAAGTGAWWLSYWDTQDWLYWALVDPSGNASSGRVSFDVGSPLRSTLDDLERALPVLLPGEDPAEADFRLNASPLLNDPGRELALSARLGTFLIPSELVEAAADQRARGGPRLRLAIAPVAALGHIPWSLLVAGDHRSHDPDRLIHTCDWVLAPSAALICNAEPSEQARAPLALAIVDTANAPALGELPGARTQASTLPDTVRVLGGRHWSNDPATLTRLEQELRTVGPDTTVAFICHAIRGTDDEPSKGGIVLAQGHPDPANLQKYEILTPQAIFNMNKRGVRMPRQVIMQACDTSALKDTVSGEWLTIAPAFISAGTREVVSTVYPLPDLPSVDDPIMEAALNGDSLQVAVAQMQRERLIRWSSGHYTEPAYAPFVWAAYATIAVQPQGRANGRSRPSSQPVVADSLILALARAARDCLRTRAKRLDSGYILGSFLDSGILSDLLDGGDDSMHPASFLWTLSPYLCTEWLHIRDHGPTTQLTVDDDTVTIPWTVINALRTARTVAERDGLPLTPHHVVTTLLSEPTAARRILTILTTLTRKRPTLIRRAIEFELTKQISQRVTTCLKQTGPDKHRDIAERLITHAFTEPSGLNEDPCATAGH